MNYCILVLALVIAPQALASRATFDLGLFYRTYFNSNSGTPTAKKHSRGIKLRSRYEGYLNKLYLSFDTIALRDVDYPVRNHIDLLDLSLRYDISQFSLLFGVSSNRWGVLETINIVDVTNQSNLLVDVMGREKQGQPVAIVDYSLDSSKSSIIFLPITRPLVLPTRPGFGLPIKANKNYSIDQGSTSYAIRHEQYLGSIELAVAYFNGTSRMPRLALVNDNMKTYFDTRYFSIENFVFEAIYTYNDTIFKSEVNRGITSDSDFWAAAIGLETPLVQGSINFADSTQAIVEYYIDTRGDQLGVIFQNDLVAGLRIDVDSNVRAKTLLSYDFENYNKFYNLQLKYSIGDYMRIETDVVLFLESNQKKDIVYKLAKDDYAQLSFHITL